MKKMILAFGFLSVLGAMMAGCGGNDCEKAADEFVAKIEDCGGTVEETSGEAGECTAAAGKLALCTSACYTAAPCDCIGLGDATKCTAEDLDAYVKCGTDCSAE